MTALFSKALNCAEDARFLLEGGCYNSACDRAYFAVFNSARALLAAQGLQVARLRSAQTVSRLLSRTFGATTHASGLLETLRLADEVRRVADYEGESVEPATAVRVLAAMDEVMLQAGDLLISDVESRS